MAISMYSATVPVFVRYLTALSDVLAKAQAYCEARKIQPAVLTGARLFPDMFALSRQVQIATDHAKGCTSRLAGVEIPSFADTETTFEELLARIAKTLEYIQGFKPEQIDGSDDKDIELNIHGEIFRFKGSDYVSIWALPNFFFHTTTAYAVLRHNGVEIGKRDFMGRK